MLQAVWTVGIVLAVIAATDRRARPMLALIALVLVQTALCDALLRDRLVEIAIRAPIDLSAGLLSLNLVRREKWSLAIPAIFSVCLLVHAAFWLSYYNGVDVWYDYAYTLNVLFLLQLACLAWPGGGQLIGRASAYMGLRGSPGGRVACRDSGSMVRGWSIAREAERG